PGQLPDHARPGTGGDDGRARLERAFSGGDAEDAIARAQEALHLVLLLDDDAEVPRARRDGRRAQVWIGVAVARRVGGAQEIARVQVGAQPARRRGVEQLDLHAQALLQRDAAPRGCQLLFASDQDQIAVLAKVGIDTELFAEALVGDDAVSCQLHAQTV